MAAGGEYGRTDDRRLKLNAQDSEIQNCGSINSNKYANDGSFLELFKKQMEQNTKSASKLTEVVETSTVIRNSIDSTSSTSTLSVRSTTTCRDNLLTNNKVNCGQNKSSTDKINKNESDSSVETNQHKKALGLQFPLVGKRRGAAPVLKTGAVKKVKKNTEGEESTKNDPWSKYLAEVKKYKEKSCQDEDKTRPLVK